MEFLPSFISYMYEYRGANRNIFIYGSPISLFYRAAFFIETFIRRLRILSNIFLSSHLLNYSSNSFQNIAILVILLYSWRISVNIKKYTVLEDVYYGELNLFILTKIIYTYCSIYTIYKILLLHKLQKFKFK